MNTTSTTLPSFRPEFSTPLSPTLGMAGGSAAGRAPGGERPVDRETQDGKTQDTRLAGRAGMCPLAMLAFLCAGMLSACTVAPEEIFMPTAVLVARADQPKQFRLPVMKLGGKSSYARVAPDGERIEFHTDDEKSFRDGAIALGVGVAAWGQATQVKATEQTAQAAAKEGTKQANAKTAAELAAQKEANRHAEALMEFEMAAPTVPVAP